MEDEKTCANCKQELDIGVDAIRIDEGVIGMKDFVPLDKTLFFCSEDCISSYFDLGILPSVPKRIP
jgi:hypothetical protein